MKKTPKIIVISNQKGGVGKTTTAINLATSLVAVGNRVVIVDFDSQGNASTGLGIERDDRINNSYGLITGQVSFNDALRETIVPNLRIIPSVVDLSAADVELADEIDREYILYNKIAEADLDQDYIIVDTPPSLGILTVNALTAADQVLVPLQCEFFALEGLVHLMRTIDMVKKSLNKKLEIMGIVLTMYDRRNRLTSDVEKEVRSYMGDKVFDTVIPRNVKMSEAPSHGKPALIYDMHCVGSQAYMSLAREILNK